MIMLVGVFTAFAMVMITGFGVFNFKGKLAKTISAITFLLFIALVFVASPIFDKSIPTQTLSTMEFVEIYKDGSDKYFVRAKEDNELLKVAVNKIYKGDSNYLICKEYPETTKLFNFLYGPLKNEYDIVVTDLTIPELSAFD